MKTKGIPYARAKNALFAFALLAAIPVSAQADFASQNSISFNNRDKIPATGLLSYDVPADLASNRRYTASSSAYLPFTDINSNIERETEHPINAPKSLLSLGKTSNVDLNLKISFKRTSFTYPSNCKADIGITEYSTDQLLLYAIALKQYAKKNNFDTNYAFLSNMAMLSGKKRFFVVNLTTMEVEQSGLVSQGRGMARSRFDKQYSNMEGSKCTALGRYKIMKKYKGEFGEAYKMAGLDTSNRNAYSRHIVLHSMGCIPDAEDIMPTCISEGCPAVSVNFLASLKRIIDKSKKPILLWVFDSNLEEAIIEQKPGRNIVPKPVYAERSGHHACSMHCHDNTDIVLP
jgi:hypothetical protein